MPNQIEFQKVLANWIARATEGHLADNVEPTSWVAGNVISWWRNEVERDLEDAFAGGAAAREELNRLGGWENPQLGQALHELIHVREAIESLSVTLGFELPGTNSAQGSSN
jgi:hypothetical protein